MAFEDLPDAVDDLTPEALDAQFEEALAREARHDALWLERTKVVAMPRSRGMALRDTRWYPSGVTKQMISFTDPQRQFLTREAKRLGISVAELVRRIVDRFRETK